MGRVYPCPKKGQPQGIAPKKNNIVFHITCIIFFWEEITAKEYFPCHAGLCSWCF